MKDAFRLPSQIFTENGWVVTLSELKNEAGKTLDGVVVSRESKAGRELVHVGLYAEGEVKAPRAKGMYIQTKSTQASDWGLKYINQESKKPIDPALIYNTLEKHAARNLLSGHLLAIYFYPLEKLREVNPYLDISSRWDKELKFLLGNGELTLTAFTASVYFALTEWHEAAPAQLISNMEKVSVTTVRNRLNAARELGLIAKPGSGKRKAK